jgi:hypothetical protein
VSLFPVESLYESFLMLEAGFRCTTILRVPLGRRTVQRDMLSLGRAWLESLEYL